MSAARIPPGTRAELGLVNWLVCRVLARVAGVPDVHLFSTLAHQRGLFRAWLAYSAHMMPWGALSRRATELAILRVATLRACQYELDHHARLGRRVGIDDACLADVARGPAAPRWAEAERALLTGVDALVQTRGLDDAAFAALERHYTRAQIVELCLLVGQYEGLATTIAALGIARDR